MKTLLTEKYHTELTSNKAPMLTEAEQSRMAILVDNGYSASDQLLKESSTTADIADFTPILVPMVRRTYPLLKANQLLGNNPMKMPTGFIYSLVKEYTGPKDGVNVNSKGQILVIDDVTGLSIGDTVDNGAGATGTIMFVEVDDKSILIELDDATQLFATGDTIGGGKNVTATYSNESQFTKILKSYTGPYTTAAGEALAEDMNEVGFTVRKIAVEAKTHKLKGHYTIEMLQDLKAMHGLDAHKELMEIMSSELKYGIDRRVVNFVNDLSTATPDVTVSANDGRWEIEKYRVAAIRLDQEAMEVNRWLRKGAANKALVSPKVSVMLGSVGGFLISTPDGAKVDSANGSTKVSIGKYDGKYDVVVDDFATEDYMNVIFKPSNEKDGIGFFAPYVGANFMNTVDPESGQPAIILQSRYGLVENPLNPEMYSRTFNVNFANTALKN